jgi:hypothetical protein
MMQLLASFVDFSGVRSPPLSSFLPPRLDAYLIPLPPLRIHFFPGEGARWDPFRKPLLPSGAFNRSLPGLLVLASQDACKLVAPLQARLDALTMSCSDGIACLGAQTRFELGVTDFVRNHGRRLAVDALVFVTPVIDARFQARFSQRSIGGLRPLLPNREVIIPSVTEATCKPLASRELNCRPGTQALWGHLSGGHQHVRVMMALIATAARLVYRDVDRVLVLIRQLS